MFSKLSLLILKKTIQTYYERGLKSFIYIIGSVTEPKRFTLDVFYGIFVRTYITERRQYVGTGT